MSKETKESNENVSIEELVMSQVYAIQAIINVLERKGLATREEIFDEIQAIEESVDDCDCGCECECEDDCDCGCEQGHSKTSSK
ncbi:MAG TPA: hypothetical protein DDW50_22895 [Firmicutes bacterium]|jgi:hypothetical protein|nr:hypothetical protein [Bacillota bacterium]